MLLCSGTRCSRRDCPTCGYTMVWRSRRRARPRRPVGREMTQGRLAPLAPWQAGFWTSAGVAAGASVLNQFWEREPDALMRRTAGRPLPAGRLDPDLALLLGVSLGIAGLLELALAVNALTAALGAAALAGYVFVYTPLKKRSSLATVVGAIPGALPPMMGWCAVRGEVDLAPRALFGILFFWQIPHFLAIAWLCREAYARAGFPLLPVLDPGGAWTGRQSVLYGAALVPVSLLPSLLGLTGRIYFGGALALGVAYLGFCLAFARRRSTARPRPPRLPSLLYLPAVFAGLLLDRLAPLPPLHYAS